MYIAVRKTNPANTIISGNATTVNTISTSRARIISDRVASLDVNCKLS